MDVSSMVGSMGGMNPCMGRMSGMGSRPDPGKMFDKVDTNGDGELDQTEFQTITDKISSMSGNSIDAEQALAEYDSDGNGLLSQEETHSFMEANRPPGPPPGPPPGDMMPPSMTGEMGNFTTASFGIEQYTQVSSMNESKDLVSTLMEALSKEEDQETEESEGIFSSIDISV